MLILAVDTALGACSAAILDSSDGRVLARRHELMERGHAERLPLMVQEILGEAHLKAHDIDRFAATRGPGSFTGVRIGLAMARGLALATDKPAVGVGTLDALAGAVSSPDAIATAAVIDARRDEVYVQRFAAGEPSPPRLLPLAEAAATAGPAPVRLVGTGATLLLPLIAGATLADAPALPDATVVARLAAALDPSATADPLYLRTADAKPPQRSPLEAAIVEAGAGDCAILANLHAATFDKGWSEDEFAALMAMPGAMALLAAPSPQAPPVSFLLARAAGGEAEIVTLGTLPAARRLGLAQRLVRHLCALMEGRGIETLFIEVAEANAPARALYQSMGFVTCGRRARYYDLGDGRFDDAIVMKRAF